MIELVHTFTRDGIRLDGVYQAGADTGAAPHTSAWCLVHGTGGNFYKSTLLEHFAHGLQEMDCKVLRVNTRGHDVISNSATKDGSGKRIGAAYERTDDCRHDLAAWVAWLRERGVDRIGLMGHSHGALKCLYAVAQEDMNVEAVVSLSPPRLSYSWFCSGPKKDAFLECFHHAEQLIADGKPNALMEVTFPISFVITAATYVEKYGPDERYNFLNFARGVTCPTLITFGSQEVADNVAFQQLPEEIDKLRAKRPNLQAAVIEGGDHFYTGVRENAFASVRNWLIQQQGPSA